MLNSYMDASKGVFYVWVPIMAVCLELCLLIKDKGLIRPEEKRHVQELSSSEAGVNGKSDMEMQSQEA